MFKKPPFRVLFLLTVNFPMKNLYKKHWLRDRVRPQFRTNKIKKQHIERSGGDVAWEGQEIRIEQME